MLHKSVSIAAATLDGTVLSCRVFPLGALSRQARIAALLNHISTVLKPIGISHGPLLAATASTTGVVDETGTIVRSCLVPPWNDFPLRDELSKALRCPVRVEKDINAAAYGEFTTRAAEAAVADNSDILYISFVRGFHTGLILEGQLRRGHSSNAGEVTDVLSTLRYPKNVEDPQLWATRTAATIGALCVVVDPRLVVIFTSDGSSALATGAIYNALAQLRPPGAAPITLDASVLGTSAAVVGALQFALHDADQAILAPSAKEAAPPHQPVALRGLELIKHANQKGIHTAMAKPAQNTSTKPLRVGVVGVGARSPLALNAETSSVPAEVVAACDPHRLARERVRSRLGKDPDSFVLTSTVSDLLAADLDVVFVTSPDSTHAEVACELLEGGVAVYLEKPMAIQLDDATRILTTAYKTGTKLYVGHNMRHMSVVRTMRDLIRSGRIGEVKAIWCRHFVGSGGDFYFKDWHATREHGTGLLLQKAAHDIDVMHWLAESHTTEVVGMGDLMVYGQVTDRADHSDELMQDWYSLDNWPPLAQRGLNQVIDVEDLSMMLMRMESGVLASYQQCHFTPDYWRNYTVIGTQGRLENFGDGSTGVIKLWNKRTNFNPDGDEQFPILGNSEGHDDADQLIVDEFLRFVANGAQTETSPLGAWYCVAAGIQATDSLRDGSTPRTIPPLDSELIEYFNQNQTK